MIFHLFLLSNHFISGKPGAIQQQQIFALLDGKAPSREPQGEAYRLLVVGACNHWHRAMPFLFEHIDDYTELLMPDDLLSGNSILAATREAMTPDACQDVEVIGWLYQFYISEKKDEVFDGLKKNKKITPENIPAATQLFTPHWIVRYLVENTLGRLWLLNRPGSKLAEKMDYYIKPEQAETDFLRVTNPEEIKICDPACGSGHMLTYAFDLLYSIYEEEGVDPAEIPSMILTHNLYGIEIDERAGELAALALTMKARARQRRFFHKGIIPNICALENIQFDDDELKEYMDFVGRDLFTAPLLTTLRQFEEADNFGSLIRPDITDVGDMLQMLEAKDVTAQLFLNETHKKVLQALQQADYLSPKYHVVIANPPYMGGKGMNGRLKVWLGENYPVSKSDLMTCFMEQSSNLIKNGGFWAMINLPSWMFLGSYADLRELLVKKQCVQSLLHLGRGLFGPDFGTVAFVVKKNKCNPQYWGQYRRLFDKHVQVRRPEEIERLFFDASYGWFKAQQNSFLSIPGSPIAYWVSARFAQMFRANISFNQHFDAKQGLATGDNDRFLRFWHEVGHQEIDVQQTQYDAFTSNKKWFPYSKGGPARKWYGNHELIVDWENNGENLKEYKDSQGKRLSTLKNLTFMFSEAITWSLTSIAGILCVRWRQCGFVFDTNGMSAFPKKGLTTVFGVALLNSKVSQEVLKLLNPTMAFQSGDIDRVPVPKDFEALQEMHSGKTCIQCKRPTPPPIIASI